MTKILPRCSYCKKRIKYSELPMVHHYNFITQRDEYYHSVCRKEFLKQLAIPEKLGE